MKKAIIIAMILMFSLFTISLVSAIEPMIIRTIKEIESVTPEDVANLGFGVYQVSAQYNIGGYSQGDWMGADNKRAEDLVSGAFWVEFSWDRPETDIVLIDGAGNIRKIYLPASTPRGDSTYGEYYWIAEDGSSYYAHTSHSHGWPDLTHEEALVEEHLARETLSPEQRNPEEEEPPVQGIGSSGDVIKIKGRIIDEITNEPIAGARLSSAYEFSPDEIISDSNGNFEFIVRANFEGGWHFYADCYGWADSISLQPNYNSYGLALRKSRFDAEEEITDVSGQDEIDVGIIFAWPSADISTDSDIEASFNVQYKYKNLQGYNGPGNGNYKTEHYLTSALPLDYDVFIQFEDEQGREYKSTTYHTPLDAKCGVITLKYFDGNSEWFFLSEIQPDEETGPIPLPEQIKDQPKERIARICDGCLENKKCYPFNYRRSGEYCSIDNQFVDQLKAGSSCDNNFECQSNVCVDSECISGSLLKKIIAWFRRVF
jgi:hypothetical protein